MPEIGVPTLARLLPSETGEFVTPVKRINDGPDLTFWLTSVAYRDLTLWLLQLNRCMFPSIDSASKYGSPFTLDRAMAYSPQLESVRSILATYDSLIAKAPPHTGPRRFGNAAFRDWYHLAEEATDELLKACLKTGGCDRAGSALIELRAYLLGSLGSPQRLDYGTGHELSFLAFLGGLWKLGLFEDGEERAIVSELIQPYLELIRKVILTYTLEPAGSHGVWGLDDHSFVPYILGSAQYGPPIDHADRTRPIPTEGSFKGAPGPNSVTKKDSVADLKDSNMYFSAIQFIYDVKRGPFWEHSPVLYDISGIKDGWGKINKGMLKMYAAEVLGKFPVVQHFPFGHLFRWEADPDARQMAASIHAQAQPGPRTDAAPATAVSAGTLPGPTARPPPSTLSGGGIPSTRAPWAGTGVATARPGMASPTSQHTVAPWQARRGG